MNTDYVVYYASGTGWFEWARFSYEEMAKSVAADLRARDGRLTKVEKEIKR